MPGMNGIYIGNELKKANKNVIILWLPPIPNIWWCNAFSCIPLSFQTSGQVAFSPKYERCPDILQFHYCQNSCWNPARLYSFPASQIIAIEAQSRKVIVHTVQQDFDSIYTMDYWLNLLPKNSFFQTHRSFIINLDHVVDFDHFTIHLSNPQLTAYLTRRKYSSFKNAYLLYLESMR